jgi:hypothetical protein
MLFQSNSTALLNRRPCNLPLICRRSGKPSAQFTYYAPTWALAKAFHFTAVRLEAAGFSARIAVRAPRVITGPSVIWQLISTGSVKKIQRAFDNKVVSLHDVDEDGESLLHVS